MRVIALSEFRILDKGDGLQKDYVNPYYLEDLKKGISVADESCCHCN